MNLDLSCFEIIGPVMIGPSSSHTAGACRIANWARLINANKTPVFVRFTLYGSFSKTTSGHGTDRALLAGMLGFDVDDIRIRQAFSEAASAHMKYEYVYDKETVVEHPNTVKVEMYDAQNNVMSVTGQSLGGGRARICEINGIKVDFSGRLNTIVIEQEDKAGVLAYIARCLSQENVNIAFLNLFREQKGARAYTFVETDSLIPEAALAKLRELHEIKRVLVLRNEDVEEQAKVKEQSEQQENFVEEDYLFSTGEELLQKCSAASINISEFMMRREIALSHLSRQQIYNKMLYAWQTMQNAVNIALTKPERSMGKLIGGEAKEVNDYLAEHPTTVGGIEINKAVAYALATLEHNACMGKIVAAPTAGASGVLPAALMVMREFHKKSEHDLVYSLFTAGAVGFLINLRSSLAGATGGCQAEVGSAAAMAAAAVCELAAASNAAALQAATIALMNALGLVCDPVGGLVEVPCQVRNAMGVANALTAATMAISGLKMLVPFDEMVEVQKKVGDSMPAALRETAEGGTAQAPSALNNCAAKACGGCAFA